MGNKENQSKKTKINTLLLLLGGSASFAGALMQLSKISFAPYVYSLGAAALIVLHFLQHEAVDRNDLRMQRLARISLMSSLLLGLGAYFMFTDSNLWVPATLIYALTTIFLSFRSN